MFATLIYLKKKSIFFSLKILFFSFLLVSTKKETTRTIQTLKHLTEKYSRIKSNPDYNGLDKLQKYKELVSRGEGKYIWKVTWICHSYIHIKKYT